MFTLAAGPMISICEFRGEFLVEGAESATLSNKSVPREENSHYLSPPALFLVFFVLTVCGMSVISQPRRIRCFQCWRAGVPPVWLVCLSMVVVQIGFGLYPVVVKKFADSGNNKANPLIFSFYRDMCCFPVLFICAFIAERKVLIPRPPMLLLLILLGLFGMFGNQYLYIMGVYSAGPNIAAVLQPTIPVWTAIIAFVTLTEKITSPLKIPFWAKMFGILLSAGGAIEITLVGQAHSDNSSHEKLIKRLAGYLYLFGNTICMGIYIVLQKRFIFDQPKNIWKDYPVTVTAYSYFFGAIFMGLCSLQYTTTEEHRALFQIPYLTLYALVYATFITSALCYLLITWANSQISSIVVTAFWPVQVLVTCIASWIVLKETFLPLQYLGAIMLIGGLFFVLWANYQEGREKEGRGGIIGEISLDCGLFEKVKMGSNINGDDADKTKKPLLSKESISGGSIQKPITAGNEYESPPVYQQDN